MADRICEESKKRITTSIRTSVKCAITLTSLVLSERMIVLFVCITETPIEMAVMLSKIFILLAGHSSETYSYLADMEPVKKRSGCIHYWSARMLSIHTRPIWKNSICACVETKDFTVLCSHSLSLALSTFLALSPLLIHSQLCGTLCVTLSGFCSWLHWNSSEAWVHDGTRYDFTSGNLKFSPQVYFPCNTHSLTHTEGQISTVFAIGELLIYINYG